MAIGIILVLSAFFGAPTLTLSGISFDVFAVADGIALAFIGFSMLTGTMSGPPTPADTGADSDAPPSLPRLILFAASPGTITGVITGVITRVITLATAHHSKLDITIVAIVAIVTGAGGHMAVAGVHHQQTHRQRCQARPRA